MSNEQPQKETHWIDYVADLISGRMHNTFEALNERMAQTTGLIFNMEITMTLNEERIMNAVASLKTDRENIAIAVNALREKIAQTPVATEDLSEELAALDAAVSGVHETATTLETPVAPVVSENHTDEGVADPTIDHDNNPSIPLAGESGPTDAGVNTEVPQPGAPIEDPATTPVVEDAQGDAGLPAGEAQSPSEPAEESTDSGDDEGTSDDDVLDDDEDDFDTAPPAPIVDDAPPAEVPVDQALPETQEPTAPEVPVSDPEFVASDPATGEPVSDPDKPTGEGNNW